MRSTSQIVSLFVRVSCLHLLCVTAACGITRAAGSNAEWTDRISGKRVDIEDCERDAVIGPRLERERQKWQYPHRMWNCVVGIVESSDTREVAFKHACVAALEQTRSVDACRRHCGRYVTSGGARLDCAVYCSAQYQVIQPTELSHGFRGRSEFACVLAYVHPFREDTR